MKNGRGSGGRCRANIKCAVGEGGENGEMAVIYQIDGFIWWGRAVFEVWMIFAAIWWVWWNGLTVLLTMAVCGMVRC